MEIIMNEEKAQYINGRIERRAEIKKQDFEVPISMEAMDVKLGQNGVRNSTMKKDSIHNMGKNSENGMGIQRNWMIFFSLLEIEFVNT